MINQGPDICLLGRRGKGLFLMGTGNFGGKITGNWELCITGNWEDKTFLLGTGNLRKINRNWEL